MTEVCNDVKVEPVLNELTGEQFRETTANIKPEARLNVSARDFWVTHQKAFFDIRVFNPTARSYDDLDIKKCYEINEREKKKQYNERVLKVEQGTFSPMVFSAFGGMARECSMVIATAASLMASEDGSHCFTLGYWTHISNFCARVCVCIVCSG